MGALLTAALPALGQIGGALLGMQGQTDANQANARQAQLNRDFQERMSSTAYQRAVADMRAAGLNPALAYQQGGASSPTGSTPAPMQNTLGQAANGVTNAVQVYGMMQNAAKTQAETKLTEAQANQLALESAARLAELQGRAGITTSNARWLQDTFEERARAILIRNEIGSLENQRRSNELPYQVSNLRLMQELMRAQVRNTNANAQLSEYGQAAARNISAAADTWFGRMIVPYINSALQMRGILR